MSNNPTKDNEIVEGVTKSTRPTTRMTRNNSADYQRYLADVCYEQEEYEKALHLYHQALRLAQRNNVLLISFIEASIASTYSKLHDYDLAEQYYRAAQNMMGQYLARSSENPTLQIKKRISLFCIIFFTLVLTTFVATAVHDTVIGYNRAEPIILVNLMFNILLFGIIGYFVVVIATFMKKKI